MVQISKPLRVLLPICILIITALSYVFLTISIPTSIPTPITEQLRDTDIIHTVKTTKKFHYSRLNLLLWTWISEVPGQTYVITDEFDPFLCLQLGCGHQVVAKDCGTTHSGRSLSCKLGVEYDTYMENATKWWCHWDDDNYVNLRALRDLLTTYDHEQPWYVGRRSLDKGANARYGNGSVHFDFAHGGCGFCVSRAMATLLKPLVHKGAILAARHGPIHNDDVMIGIFVTHVLGLNVTTSDLFNSHYHKSSLKALVTPDEIVKQISLSYNNNIHVTFGSDDATFSKEEDPTRFLSIHCHLHPTTEYCQRIGKVDIAAPT